MLAEFTLI